MFRKELFNSIGAHLVAETGLVDARHLSRQDEQGSQRSADFLGAVKCKGNANAWRKAYRREQCQYRAIMRETKRLFAVGQWAKLPPNCSSLKWVNSSAFLPIHV
jgi:hypothetical protein